MTIGTYHTALQFLSKIFSKVPIAVLLPYLLSQEAGHAADKTCNTNEQSVLIMPK